MQAIEDPNRTRRIGHHAVLGDLEREVLGAEIVLAQQRSEPVTEMRVVEAARRQVDSDVDSETATMPAGTRRNGMP